jgi:8-oxo-dGTP pyrophosphatase MutT (NUDIX family)
MASISPGTLGGLVDRLVARLGPVDVSAALNDGCIPASVALLLRGVSGKAAGVAGAEILFISRSRREGDPWSGHIAFPGGHAESTDPSLVDTVVREVSEEVGIDLRRGGRILGSLPTVGPLSDRLPSIAVTPFLALVPEGAVVRPDPEEVEALKHSGPTDVIRREVRGAVREWPAYPSSRGPIWGITERILTGFLALVE